MAKPFLDVAVGLLRRHDGKILLNQRPEGKPWAGWWELPGGKLEPGETVHQALARELHEELGIRIRDETAWVTYTHEYPKTLVQLRFHQVHAWDGEVQGLEGQKLAWVDPATALQEVSPLLPASLPPLLWAVLPDKYLITSIGTPDQLPAAMKKLEQALQQGIRLVQFREPTWDASGGCQTSLYEAFRTVIATCHKHGAACLLNSRHPAAWQAEADGVHYRAQDAARQHPSDDAPTEPVPITPSGQGLPGALRGTRYVAVSVHNLAELNVAQALQADFVVIGHVLPTPSHPDQPALGWDGFQALAQQAGLPALALGGQANHTLETARRHGAHGIAAIRGLLPATA